MASLVATRSFNRPERVVEGWYWAVRADDVGRGKARAAQVAGRDLVVYRGADGSVRALDAYCPHMGAHLAEGFVEGTALRCFFHGWKFEGDGACVEVPCARDAGRPHPKTRVRAWPCVEAYGLVWVWVGADAPAADALPPLPHVPELGASPRAAQSALANRFVKNCHPSVVLINAIDAQHFNTVHNLPVRLDFAAVPFGAHGAHAMTFSNTTEPNTGTAFGRFLRRFYARALTYSMCYWFGSSGTVTLGPDFWHFHILFALRPTDDGGTEGQTVLITRARPGLLGRAFGHFALALTRVVGAYFARGDTKVFQTIRFALKTPIEEDLAIIRYVQHVERQPVVAWGTWEPVPEDAAADAPSADAAPGLDAAAAPASASTGAPVGAAAATGRGAPERVPDAALAH